MSSIREITLGVKGGTMGRAKRTSRGTRVPVCWHRGNVNATFEEMAAGHEGIKSERVTNVFVKELTAPIRHVPHGFGYAMQSTNVDLIADVETSEVGVTRAIERGQQAVIDDAVDGVLSFATLRTSSSAKT
jgi:hypothetical protein